MTALSFSDPREYSQEILLVALVQDPSNRAKNTEKGFDSFHVLPYSPLLKRERIFSGNHEMLSTKQELLIPDSYPLPSHFAESKREKFTRSREFREIEFPDNGTKRRVRFTGNSHFEPSNR